MKLAEAIAADFQERFGYQPLQVRAPGRINLIGEHTDYNAGFVMPAAVDKEMYFAVGLNDTGTIRLRAYDLNESFEMPADRVHRSEVSWANYLLGVVAQFQQRGVQVPGFDCVMGGNVPIGAGMSSSAAVECGLAFALNSLLDAGLGRMEMAHIGQAAEHEYAGVKSGIMDQFASLFGQAAHLVRLDCRSMEYEYFPFDTSRCRLVLCNSGVKHSLASSEYNKRREECEQGVAVLQQHYPQVKSLRDATLAQLAAHQEEMGPVVYRRCNYVVQENQRVLEASEQLVQHNLQAVGQLMYASHAGLRDDYEVSCRELDVLVELAEGRPGVYGARMMGGGFGGCTINLVAVEQVEPFVGYMTAEYEKRTGIKLETYQTTIVGGVSAQE